MQGSDTYMTEQNGIYWKGQSLPQLVCVFFIFFCFIFFFVSLYLQTLY